MSAARASMSQSSFGDDDYDYGEIKKLVVGTAVWHALHEELWLNCSESTRHEYLVKLNSPNYFVGTVVSHSRKQVELTVIPFNAQGDGPGDVDIIAISLDNVARFHSH